MQPNWQFIVAIIGIFLAISALGIVKVDTSTTLRVCPQDCPFESLQRAIKEANPGDKVVIESGTYEETLSIEKPLTLKGSNPQDVTLRPATHQDQAAITLNSADEVTIADLSIKGFDGDQIGILIQNSSASLSGLRITNVKVGIDASVFERRALTLRDNRISGRDSGVGIRVLGNYDAEIVANEVLDKTAGVTIAGTGISKIANNTLFSNTTGLVLGARVESRVVANEIRRSAQAGVQVNDRARLTLIQNDIRENGWGVALWQRPCFDTEQVFNGTVRGADNVIEGNVRGPLCPEDFSWPEGFVANASEDE